MTPEQVIRNKLTMVAESMEDQLKFVDNLLDKDEWGDGELTVTLLGVLREVRRMDDKLSHCLRLLKQTAEKTGLQRKCPRGGSPDPARHPAVQREGEVQVCADPSHVAAAP